MPPNILIIMPDQFRADCLSAAGHPVVRTPNLDRLVAESVRFARAYTTSPICMPARSSFLSGQFCHNHGQWANYGSLPADADTYLHHVRAAGYHTCHIGKSHLYPHGGDHLREHEPFMRGLGFADVLETTGPHATRNTNSILTDHWERLGCLSTFRDDYARRAQHGFLAATWPSPLPLGETMDDFVGRTAVEYLESYDRPAPWLTFVGFGGPHEPWDPPADWAARYPWEQMDPPAPVCPPDPWLPPVAAAHQGRLQAPPHLTPEVQGRIRALYYAKISHIDDWIGRILATVARRGWADHTAVLFWSDHGEMLGDKGRYHKSVFYEASVHVPFLLRLPDRCGAGQARQQLVSLVDAFPTILELAGCAARPREFGRSLLPLIGSAAAPHHDAVFSEIEGRTMVRTERHKLVVGRDGETLKLYDLAAAPGETVNLVGQAGTADLVRSLHERLRQWHLATATDWRHLHRQPRS